MATFDWVSGYCMSNQACIIIYCAPAVKSHLRLRASQRGGGGAFLGSKRRMCIFSHFS